MGCRLDRWFARGRPREPEHAQYIGTDKEAPGVSVTGLLYGETGNQLLLQLAGAAFIIAYNAIATFITLRSSRSSSPRAWMGHRLAVGDDAVHGETAYAITVKPAE
jgi:ammonium transporter, Amt family